MPCVSSATSSLPCAGSSSRSRSASSSSGSSSGRMRGERSSAPPIPDERIRFRSVFGSYLAGVGVNSIVPARAGDAVKLYLVKHRIEGSTYATLTPTLVAETILDMFVAGTLIGWALAIGALAHPPGLLAAAVGRLGLLRQAGEVDRDRSRAGRRCARDRARRFHRARRRRPGARDARLRDHPPSRAGSSPASSYRRRSRGCSG